MADSLSGILSLLQSFSSKTGTTTTSGGSSTKQTVLSQEAMNAMLKSALEGNSGLADVVNSQNKSGLYNSTTNSMLTNDLLSRLTAQVATAGAPTTTTTTPTKSTTVTPAAVSGIGAAGTAVGALGLSAAKPFLDKLLNAKKSVVDIAGDVVGNSASQSSESIASMAGELNADTASYLSSAADGGDAVSAVTDTLANGISSIADSLAGEAGGLAAEAIGTTIGDTFVEYGGSAMANAAAEEAASVAAAEGAASIGGSWCFLTTAVCEYQGKPDDCYELQTLRKFRDSWLKENHPGDIETYYAHAPAIVTKIKALPNAAELFDKMYYSYILPAVNSIAVGDNKAAYFTYRQLYNFCVEA